MIDPKRSAELEKQFRTEYENTTAVMKARAAATDARFHYRLLDVQRIEDSIEQGFFRYCDARLKQLGYEASTVKKLPRADQDELNTGMTMFFVLTDIMESVIVDMDEAIHRTLPEASFSFFRDVVDAAKNARAKLEFLDTTVADWRGDRWADVVDNTYDMIKNKANKYLRDTERIKQNNA